MRDRTISRRPAFTLVELLVTITILTLLASIVLFGMAGVQAQARDRRARAQILRIHNLIAEKWQSYESRRVVIDPAKADKLAQKMGRPYLPLGVGRLIAIRELLRMELPERISDVVDPPILIRGTAAEKYSDAPTLWKAYHRRVAMLWNDDAWWTKDPNKSPPETWTIPYQGAECLYLILSKIQDGETNGLKFFNESEIGDKDGDRMPEIHDPWGNPVGFLRWAPGFTSPTSAEFVGGISTLQKNNPLDGWDPFDPLDADGNPNNSNELSNALRRPENDDLFDDTPGNDITNSNFAMFPLIFSAGADGENNLRTDTGDSLRHSGLGGPTSEYGYPNDPYAIFTESGKKVRMGQLFTNESRGHIDNITNHLIESP